MVWRMTMLRWAGWGLLGLLVACGEGQDGDGAAAGSVAPPEPSGLPTEVERIFDQRCWECHSDPTKNYAPMPLTTWGQVQAESPDGTPFYVLIGQRINNPDFPMPPITREPLSEEEVDTLNSWVEQGAPMAPE